MLPEGDNRSSKDLYLEGRQMCFAQCMILFWEALVSNYLKVPSLIYDNFLDKMIADTFMNA